MDRLTKKEYGSAYFPYCFREDTCGGQGSSEKCGRCNLIEEVCDKLADYEEMEEQGTFVKVPAHYLDTIKLLTLAAMSYQENMDVIMGKLKDSEEIRDLFAELTMVQYTTNLIKLSNLVESGLDVDSITKIDDIVDIFYPQQNK